VAFFCRSRRLHHQSIGGMCIRITLILQFQSAGSALIFVGFFYLTTRRAGAMIENNISPYEYVKRTFLKERAP
jgi:hypothetical protein